MTVQEIINYTDRKYPNSETTANKVIDLNIRYSDLYVALKKLSNEVSIYEDTTVANQVFYNLPTYARIYDVVKITVAQDSTAEEFDTYEYAGISDDISSGYYYGPIESEYYFLINDDEPIAIGNLKILVYYYKRPTPLSASALSAEPDLDPDYHSLLCYALISELASQGDNPDTEIADYWQKRYDEKFAQIKESLAARYDAAPLKIKQVEEYW